MQEELKKCKGCSFEYPKGSGEWPHLDNTGLCSMCFDMKTYNEALKYSNFSQAFKMKAWDLGFKGEKKLDELADFAFNYFNK